MVNLESMNATLIKQGLGRRKRYEILSEIAQSQLQSLNNADIENRFPTSTAKQRHSLTEMFQYSVSKRRSRIRILLIIRSLRTDISAPARGTLIVRRICSTGYYLTSFRVIHSSGDGSDAFRRAMLC